MYDVIVIGGGIIGSSVAFHLAKDGADTLLVDRHDTGRATDAGAGIISPTTSSRSESDRWFEFADRAAGYYPSLVAEIEELTGLETGYDRRGLLSVAVDSDEVSAFEALIDRDNRRRHESEELSQSEPTELTGDEARERFPALGSVERALYIEEAARVDGGQFTDVLRAAAIEYGLSVVEEDAGEIEVTNGSVTGVVTDVDSYEAEAVVVAGGAWSSDFSEQLGISIPVGPQRGQIAHLMLPDENPDAAGWPVVKAFRGHYIVPWPAGRIVAGATRETGSSFDPRTTVEGVAEVLNEALRVAPGLADATVEEIRVGLRPASTDGLPILGAAPGIDGAYLATGHGPTGLQLGPFSGRMVAALIRGKSSEADLSAFDPRRFQ